MIYFIVLILILLVYAVLQSVSLKKEKKARKFFKNKIPLVFAHRGSSHLFPENTEFAFDRAFSMGVDGFETDIRLTKDKEIITHHNEDIDETSNGCGKVIDYTVDEIQSFNFGYKFVDINGNKPFLEKVSGLNPMKTTDFFRKYGNRVLYSIDVKDEGENGKIAAELLYKYVKEFKLEKNVIFASFHDEITDYLRNISNGDIIISGSKNKSKEVVYSSYLGYDFFKKFDTQGLQLPTFHTLPLATKYLIYKLHKHNMFIQYWTINTKDEMKKLIDKKVDGITTDRVDIFFDLTDKN